MTMNSSVIRLMIFLSIIFLILNSCSSDSDDSDDPGPQDNNAGRVSGLILDDVANMGNASDLEITFRVPQDETTVGEYHVFIVKFGSSLTLESANAFGSELYTTISKTGSKIIQRLSDSAVDTDGNPVSEGNTYGAYVLSVADGTNANMNVLSTVSNFIKVAVTTVKITYLRNDGVLISDGENKVIIDGLYATLSGWIEMESTDLTELSNAVAPYDNANLLLATHAHGDHFTSSEVNTYLARSSSTRFIGPPSLSSNVSSEKVEPVSIDLHEKVSLTVNGIDLDVLHLTHFQPQDPNLNFSNMQHYGFLIKMGGLKILHLGDHEMTTENLQAFSLLNEAIDVVLIPTFTFSNQLSNTKAQVLADQINPANVIGLHLATGTLESTVKNIYPDAIVFMNPKEFVRF